MAIETIIGLEGSGTAASTAGEWGDADECRALPQVTQRVPETVVGVTPAGGTTTTMPTSTASRSRNEERLAGLR